MYLEIDPKMDGSQGSKSQNATSEPLTLNPGAEAWIASQQAFLARILAQQVGEQASAESDPDCFSRSSEQLTLFDQDTFSSKTHRLSEHADETSSSANWWRADIPGATEKLERLTLAHHISATDGFCLLPTVTVCGNWNRKGASARSGDGIATALNKMPTLTATELSGGRTVPAHVPMSGVDPETGRKYQVGIKEAVKRLPTLTANSYGSNQGGAAGRTGKKRKSLAGMLPTLMAADGEKNSINTKDSRGTGNYFLTGRIARLPTLIARDGERGGVKPHGSYSQGLRVRLAQLPTLCASDYKSPYSEAGYKKQRQKRSKPLRDTLEHTTGHRLTATVAEWFMDFPLNHTASRRWVMRKCRSKRQRRG